MKKLGSLFALAGLLYTNTVYAAPIPLSPELENLFNGFKRVVVAVWNPSAISAHGSSTTDSGAHPLGVTLPAGAIITNSYFYATTTFTDAGNNGNAASVAFHCEDAANILAAKDVTGLAANKIYGLKQYGGSTVGVAIGAEAPGITDLIANTCNVTATVTNDGVAAGKGYLFLEYVLPVSTEQ